MTAFIALLRAVNVGGTGKLPMSALKSACDQAGLAHARTYIASGNVVFTSRESEAAVKTRLESLLSTFAARKIDVLVRTLGEMEAVRAGNPFPDAAPNRLLVTFLDAPPPFDLGISHQNGEQILASGREIYIHYGAGMGQSKLAIRAAREGTARNFNTISKLCELAAALPS